MSMQYTKMPTDTFEKLQLNAGIMVDTFDPATGTIGNILGATSGGINFSTNPEYEDFGEDVDNCPPNMKELKRLISYDPQMSGTFLTCTPAVIGTLIGGADISLADSTRVIPRQELETTDFHDVWWIGDYSDKNKGTTAGFLAIHLINALNQSGFQIQSGKNAKGTMTFEFHGHYSMSNQDEVPFEVYCKSGTASVIPVVMIDKHYATLSVGDTLTLTAGTTPSNGTVTWSSGTTSVATVSNGVVTAVSAGNAIITASMTYEGVTVTDTCTVVVSAAS